MGNVGEVWGKMLENGNVANSILNEQESMLQRAIEGALQNVIVIPLKKFCIKSLSVMLEMSYVGCLVVAVGGMLFMFCGIEKGKKAAIGASLTYIMIRVAEEVVKEVCE